MLGVRKYNLLKYQLFLSLSFGHPLSHLPSAIWSLKEKIIFYVWCARKDSLHITHELFIQNLVTDNSTSELSNTSLVTYYIKFNMQIVLLPVRLYNQRTSLYLAGYVLPTFAMFCINDHLKLGKEPSCDTETENRVTKYSYCPSELRIDTCISAIRF